MTTSTKLKNQLLHLVGWPLFLLLVIESFVSYEIGIHTANQVFDRWLLDSARSLAQELREHDGALRFEAHITAIEVFEWDELDRVYFRVETEDGSLLAGTDQLGPTASRAELQMGPKFSDLTLDGDSVRAVSVLVNHVSEQGYVVTVAETLNKRLALTSDLLVEVLVTKFLLFVLLLLIVSYALERGLKPLVMLSRELGQRSPQDMTAINMSGVPGEVRSLFETTNLLLSRLDFAMTSREQFIGNIAHQIRTPLAGIKLQAQLAERNTETEEVRQALTRISKATDQMAHINSQLLKLARAEAASGRGLRGINIDLVAIANSCLKDLRRLAQQRRISCVIESPASPVIVQGEIVLLREMIVNLVENAILYGIEGGHVWLKVEQSDEEVLFIVEDDGPGIPQEALPRIFDRFFRPSLNNTDGCGLGLAIVREIALAHGASVQLKERDGGSGARFVTRFTRSLATVSV